VLPLKKGHADMKVNNSTNNQAIFVYLTDRKNNDYGPPSTAFSMSSRLKA